MSPFVFDTGIPFLQAGELYALGCALLWAVAVILFRKSGEEIEPVALNLFKGVVGLILFLVTMKVFGVPFFPAEVPHLDWIVLLGSGALGIGIADSVFFASLNRLGAGRSAIVDCLYSPFVVICSALYLGEPQGPFLLPAMALMVVAIMVGSWNPEERATDQAQRRILREGVVLGAVAMLCMAAGIVVAIASLWFAAKILSSCYGLEWPHETSQHQTRCQVGRERAAVRRPLDALEVH